jgi:signal transduction histidine kinase
MNSAAPKCGYSDDEIQDKRRQLAGRQLAEASEHKSHFDSSMSHELRTPLNTIIGLTEMMVSNSARFGTEKAQEPLQRVHRATNSAARRPARGPRRDQPRGNVQGALLFIRLKEIGQPGAILE